MNGDALILDTVLHSPAPIPSYTNIFLLCHCLGKSVVYMLVSSQIRPACPCSRKKACLAKAVTVLTGQGKSIFQIALFAAKVSLQQFVSSLTDCYSHLLARYNNVCNVCMHLNLSILITST